MADFWNVDTVQHRPLGILVTQLARQSVVATRLRTRAALNRCRLTLEESSLELSK